MSLRKLCSTPSQELPHLAMIAKKLKRQEIAFRPKNQPLIQSDPYLVIVDDKFSQAQAAVLMWCPKTALCFGDSLANRKPLRFRFASDFL
jgi:hypothetical protein